MANAIGRLIIQMERAVQECEFTNEDEREKFLEDLARSLPNRLNLTLKTWRANEHERNSASPKPVNPVDSASYADRADALREKGLSAYQQQQRERANA